MFRKFQKNRVPTMLPQISKLKVGSSAYNLQSLSMKKNNLINEAQENLNHKSVNRLEKLDDILI
jgi:hypothetical protein